MNPSSRKKHKVVLAVAGVIWLAVAGVLAFTVFNDGDDPSAADVAGATDSTSQEPPPPAEPASDDGAATTDSDQAVEPSTTQDEIVRVAVPLVNVDDENSGASGDVDFELNTVSGEVCFEVSSEQIDGPYRSHIHAGGPGEQGGIVVDLGPLESGSRGCVDNLPVDTTAVLDDLAGHYAELHDASETFTIRGQLADAVSDDASAPTPDVVDPDGGGARIVLEQGTIRLEGTVADQATADDLIGSVAGVDSATAVENGLEIAAGAPLPSGRVLIADRVFFEVNSDQVRSIDDPTLAAITGLARSRPDWILTVVGHTDARGSDVYNLELSLRRATALRNLLAEQGLPAENLRIRGAGETDPIGDNTKAVGQARNRRIEFEFAPR